VGSYSSVHQQRLSKLSGVRQHHMNIHVPGQGAKVQGQFQTDCKKAQEAALLCATTHPEERQRCDKFFAAYRECRKAEHSRILEARGQGR